MIKRTISLAAVVTTALVLVQGPQAARADDPVDTVNGNVELLTRFTDGNAGYPGLGRRLWLAHSGTNGLVSYIFPISAETRGGHFDLKLLGDQTGEADLGIYLYSWFGNMEATTGPGAATSVAEYDATGKGGEVGGIPEDARWALVFMKNGAHATFQYNGFAAPVVGISSAGFSPADLTIRAGSTVTWRNDDAAFHGVRSDAVVSGEEGDEPVFTSGEKATQGIGEGRTFKHRFTEAGTFTYVDRFTGARGSITVVGTPGTPAA